MELLRGSKGTKRNEIIRCHIPVLPIGHILDESRKPFN
jgi:hypothetical protein